MGEWITEAPENHAAYLAVPERGRGAGVLVLHAWWGLTPDITEICDRLAGEGYVALAPGLYSGGATASTIADAEALVAAHDDAPEVAETAVLAAVDRLRELQAATGEQIAVIGLSLGAYWALHASQIRPDDICAVVTIYGSDGGDYSTARAAYLGHFAENDDFEPPAAVSALEARIRNAGHDVTFHIYPGTGHWFVEPSRSDAYNAAATEQVWERTLAFLEKHLT